jgi:hypothetical protein
MSHIEPRQLEMTPSVPQVGHIQLTLSCSAKQLTSPLQARFPVLFMRATPHRDHRDHRIVIKKITAS